MKMRLLFFAFIVGAFGLLFASTQLPDSEEIADSFATAYDFAERFVVSELYEELFDDGEVLGDTAVYENRAGYHLVTRVVDGDTIDVQIDDKVERIRLIGINTPETKDPRKPVECFGVEAYEEALRILDGRYVRLESDDTQQDRDYYGRLLRYVYRDDGLFYNHHMIEMGYAYEYTYRVPYRYQSQFKEAQQNATQQKRGLWNPLTCQS